MRKGDTLSSRRKAAVMITLLGEHAAQVLQQFDTEQIEAISVEIARLDMVTSAQREQIITEFHELATAQEYIGEGGVEQARKVLESAFGAEKAEAYMQRITAAMQVVPFEFLKKADPHSSSPTCR
jgi:flagellar motor switch protein FliG